MHKFYDIYIYILSNDFEEKKKKEAHTMSRDYQDQLMILTRAKSKVILVGQRQAVFMAVNKTETDKRNTQLGRRI